MESIFSIVIIFLTLLFYFSNRENLINRWCALYLAIASIGVIKEAFLYQIIPCLQSRWGDTIKQDVYIGIYSVLTWVTYSFAAPALFIMGLYFLGLNISKPKLLAIIKAMVCIPAIILSFIYSPVSFRAFQLTDHVFWVVYSVYNLSLGVVTIALMLRGIAIEKSKKIKRHKIILSMVILPASVYVLITIFVIHPLGLTRWFKIWQWNIIIVTISTIAVLVMAFKNGFLGLKLSAQNYNWDSDMDLVGRGADYTSHMLKNQTSKMELCIEQLERYFSEAGEEPPEEIAILSRSVCALKSYVDKIKRHSQNIRLFEEQCRLTELLDDAMPVSLSGHGGIAVKNEIPENVFWFCDKSHMTEVFSNIILNAVEAMRGTGTIWIAGACEKSHYLLRIADTGTGMTDDDICKIFTPYYTTKSTEKNSGLGLAYCKNVITKHGGGISAKSEPDIGTTITIEIPLRRVSKNGAETELRFNA